MNIVKEINTKNNFKIICKQIVETRNVNDRKILEFQGKKLKK